MPPVKAKKTDLYRILRRGGGVRPRRLFDVVCVCHCGLMTASAAAVLRRQAPLSVKSFFYEPPGAASVRKWLAAALMEGSTANKKKRGKRKKQTKQNT